MKKTICFIAAALLASLLFQSEGLAARRSGSYQIRVSSYQEESKANLQARDLKELGHDAYVEKVVIKGKGTWYRVCLGSYKSKAAAEQAGRKLEASGIIINLAVQESSRPAPPEKPVQKAAAEKKTGAKPEAAAKPASDKPAQTPAVPAQAPASTAAQPVAPVKTAASATPGSQTPAAQTAAAPAQKASQPETPAKTATPAQPPAQPKPAAQPATQAAPQQDAQSFPKNDLFQSAMADFNAGKFYEALPKFQEVSRENLDPVAREKVQRRLADCHYQVGIKGSNQDLLKAVDLYKELLQKYPNAREENQEALYRLAKSYVHLKFFYEARREFQNLYSQYHESPHLEEAIYMMTDMAYRTRNFPETVLRAKEYLNKYPDGEYAQKCYFAAADSFSQLQQNDQADLWYGQAVRKWGLEQIPKDPLLKMGYHFFRNKKHPDAVRIFFFFLNLYPDDEASRDVLYSIARSFMDMEQYAISVKMFSLLIERFPDSREAQESAIVMANIGVKKPGLKIPDIPGILNYRDPLKVYNDLLAQSGTGEMTEGLLFQKGYALWKYGRHEEAFESFSLMARLFPQGRYREEGTKNLLMTLNFLVEENYAKGDYLAVSSLYFKTPESVLLRDTDHMAVFHIAEAMKQIGLLFDSKRVLEALLKMIPPGQENGHVLLAMADIENRRARYDEAESLLQQVMGRSRDRRVLAGVQQLRGDMLLRKGQYGKAAGFYAESLSYGEEPDNAAVFYRNYGFALKESDSCQSAIANFQKALSHFNKSARENRPYPKDVFVTSYQGLGHCYFRENRFQEAVAMFKQSMINAAEGREGLWALYDAGRAYLRANNPAQAEKAFTELKSRGGEEFWSNIIDYYVRENAWTEKYAKYLK